MDWIKIMEATPSCALKAQEGVSYAFGLETWNYARFFWEEEVSTNSSLPKYLSNFPYFTGFSAHSLVK